MSVAIVSVDATTSPSILPVMPSTIEDDTDDGCCAHGEREVCDPFVRGHAVVTF